MDDILRRFPKKHVSEDKTHRKVSCWFVGIVDDLENIRAVTELVVEVSKPTKRILTNKDVE